MPPTATPPTADALLVHAEWIRALARSLVRDPDTADEVAQRTLVAAWRRPPAALSGTSLRGWVVRCIQNFARSAHRSRERHGRSEALAARHEALPSAHDVVERASLSRELVEHVLALEEPYRTAILLRYFDEKEPSEIGRELGLPAATVRTRVARGLAHLRERLDRRHGAREAWSCLFLPFLTRGAPAPTIPALLAMNTSLKIALPVAAGILALAYFALRPAEPLAAPQEAPAVVRAEQIEPALVPDAGLPTLASAPEERERTAARDVVAPLAARTPEPPAPASHGARGRVLHVDGGPAPNVRLTTSLGDGAALAAGGAREVTSAADGTFSFPGPLPACNIAASSPELVTVLSGNHGDGADENEIVIVVAQLLAGQGTVIDESGVPLADVQIFIDLPDDLRARFEVPLDRSSEESFTARSDESGSFRLERVPRVADARLVARRDGYETWASRLDEISGMPLTITLLRPGAKVQTVEGRVVDASAQPIEGAYVAFGLQTARSEADGSFRFAVGELKGLNERLRLQPQELTAAAKGFLPAHYEPPLEGGSARWPAFVELKLGAPTLAIEGKVLDHDGNARAGLKVWVADSTTFGGGERGTVQLESLLAGDDRNFWRFVESGEGGHFRIEGLLDRDYTVEALEPETLLRAQEKNVAAGSTGVTVRMPKDALFPRVAGVVRGHDGVGIAGATIGPMCDAFRARHKGRILGTSHDGLDGVRTDAEGRFELKDVPKSLVYLRIDGEGILPLEYGRYVEGDSRFEKSDVRELPLDRIESLEIFVDRRAHLQVMLGDPASADEFELLDEEGDALEMSTFTGTGRREGMRQPIRNGRSDVVAGTDRGREVVFYKGGLEVARVPVELFPGETRYVRY